MIFNEGKPIIKVRHMQPTDNPIRSSVSTECDVESLLVGEEIVSATLYLSMPFERNDREKNREPSALDNSSHKKSVSGSAQRNEARG